MKRLAYFLIAASIGAIFIHCARRSPGTVETEKQLSFKPGPPAIIYKTTHDYSNNVAVIMNEDKTEIISFPHPTDLFYNGKIARPSQLKEGYWLDNQGINKNVVFTSFSFEEYASFQAPPETKALMNSIIDKNPLESLCNCGNRKQFENIEGELNKLIEAGLKPCKKLM